MSAANKTISLISGANGGLGLATATALARDHGHHVIICSRNADNGTKVAKSLTDAGYSASSVQLDLDSESSILSAVEHLTNTYGRLDVLVNNAAILIDSTDKAKNTYDLYKQTFSTNIVGTAALTEGLLPLLKKSEHPRLVFVSSRMGSLKLAKDPTSFWYNLDCRSYDASKAALNILALNYARMLTDVNAKVNIVCPGLVATNLHVAVASGASPEDGAKRIVELATLPDDGPTATWSASDEPEIPW